MTRANQDMAARESLKRKIGKGVAPNATRFVQVPSVSNATHNGEVSKAHPAREYVVSGIKGRLEASPAALPHRITLQPPPKRGYRRVGLSLSLVEGLHRPHGLRLDTWASLALKLRPQPRHATTKRVSPDEEVSRFFTCQLETT